MNCLSSSPKANHEIDINISEKRIKIPKEKVQALKGSVGGKMLAKMKKECVDCPVTLTNISFVECFSCEHFLRRLKGKVHCAAP